MKHATSEVLTREDDTVADDTDLHAALAAAAGRRWWNRWTIGLVIPLLLLSGFITGVQVQKAYGDSGTAQPGQGGPGGFAGAEGFPGGGDAGNAFGGDGQDAAATTGTVTLVDGTTVYIETEAGDLITIRIDDDTEVRVPGEPSDLETGEKVTVEGEESGEGEVTARIVTEAE